MVVECPAAGAGPVPFPAGPLSGSVSGAPALRQIRCAWASWWAGWAGGQDWQVGPLSRVGRVSSHMCSAAGLPRTWAACSCRARLPAPLLAHQTASSLPHDCPCSTLIQLLHLPHALHCRTVVVCAPTGAGKTAIAEAATLHILSKGQRVIYTTPLKALSNQKLGEMRERFG